MSARDKLEASEAEKRRLIKEMRDNNLNFDKLKAEYKRRIQDLEQYNRSLEVKLQTKTEELAKITSEYEGRYNDLQVMEEMLDLREKHLSELHQKIKAEARSTGTITDERFHEIAQSLVSQPSSPQTRPNLSRISSDEESEVPEGTQVDYYS